MIEQDVGGFHVTMHDALCVCISQGVCDQGDRRQAFSGRSAGEHADIRAVDELQAVKRAVVVVEFERAHDMCMHQPDRKLPLAPQRIPADAFVDEDLERDGSTGDPVGREPGLGRAPSA